VENYMTNSRKKVRIPAQASLKSPEQIEMEFEQRVVQRVEGMKRRSRFIGKKRKKLEDAEMQELERQRMLALERQQELDRLERERLKIIFEKGFLKVFPIVERGLMSNKKKGMKAIVQNSEYYEVQVQFADDLRAFHLRKQLFENLIVASDISKRK
jgi:hypothetical protein